MSYPSSTPGLQRLIEQCESEIRAAGEGPAASRRRGLALYRIGECRIRLDDLEGALAPLGEAYACLSGLERQHGVAVRSRIREAEVLIALGRHAAALELIDALGAEAGGAAVLAARVAALEGLERPLELVAAAQCLSDVYGPGTSPQARLTVARALVALGVAARAHGDLTRAHRAVETVLADYAPDESSAIAKVYAQALLTQAAMLEDAGHPGRALAAYDALVSQYGRSCHQPVREMVADVRDRRAELAAQQT